MLSYQHAYHAGNHADILKHFVLYLTLNSLNKKEKPYTFFDTHSGSGLYDLLDNRILKTQEAQKGIIEILKKIDDAPATFKEFLTYIQSYTSKNMYPGSPAIEGDLMRAGDKTLLSELHPQEFENLKRNMHQLKKSQKTTVMIHHRSGWEMIKALTPPDTKRGGVLIDPSYEETQDYFDAAKMIVQVHKKWSNGIYLLWYPLLAHRSAEIENMIEAITEGVKLKNPNTEIENFQLLVNTKDSHKEVSLEELKQQKLTAEDTDYSEDDLDKKNNPPRLYGSGMLVINCPYGIKEELEKAKVFLEANL